MLNETPAVAVAGAVRARVDAAAAATVKLPESTVTAPGPESVAAARRVCAPALSSRSPANVATPPLAAIVVAPCTLPGPECTVAVTLADASAPVVTVFPAASSIVATGWVVSAEPAVAPAGCVVKTICDAAPCVIVKPDALLTLSTGDVVAPTTIVPMSWLVAVAVAMPLTAVAALGKVAVPVPDALPKVTWVALSVVTVLPPASCTVAVSVREPPPRVEPDVASETCEAAPSTIV